MKALGLLVLMIIVAAVLLPDSNQGSRTPDNPTPTSAVGKPSDIECRGSLECWAERSFASATTACRPQVEQLAKLDFKWNDGWTEPKFSHYRWRDKDKGVVTYIGDRISYQNGFGAWVRHTYECDYDAGKRTVLEVRARPGMYGR
ncbi:MAG: hypothetical protein ACK4MV_16315 [Beijerinckiaceae bacterium]